ncbi:phage terminase large subunit, partial [Klebsiella pneumoniae]|nr:phage terminase large subunit [Klebsiella pneumoniae]
SDFWLKSQWEIGRQFIRHTTGRIEYVFSGLRHNIESLKGKARILLAWVDEAEQVSEMSWKTLIPTVREPGSEIWITWNPSK